MSQAVSTFAKYSLLLVVIPLLTSCGTLTDFAIQKLTSSKLDNQTNNTQKGFSLEVFKDYEWLKNSVSKKCVNAYVKSRNNDLLSFTYKNLNCGNYYLKKAGNLRDNDKPNQAINVINQGLKLITNKNKRSELLHYRAMAKYEKGDYKGSIPDLTEALKLNDKHYGNNYLLASSHYYRGRARIETKDYSGAIADLTRTLQYQEGYLIYVHRGIAQYYSQNYKEAILDINKGISISGEAAYNNEVIRKYIFKAHRYLGLAYKKIGNKSAACSNFYTANLLGRTTIYDDEGCEK
tara:strand:- start:1392 stop:2267 length:876 start_codon:yes stop_codon:yes gene_type:complete